ncbi:HAD superfamily hydrolase (TIGR01509 family) [Lipingzhangella halophila]|uniref:HAD superfamily hydrolase (TIGR01509 family) n=1 Tax=Lipingzhangella halophila TaxID=1783352 RepID=A0A7W7W329_9ACTN|nr:HAD family phosphatase [Lipingzhangella halophila]MBB4932068.1 HAD superfamily hydrolase (TIGR01509 family) [Lipingzhangella halophila]
MPDHAGVAPQAVLLDMDGTLVDSEALWGRAEREVVSGLGGVWTDEDHRRNVGAASVPVTRYIIELTGTDVPPAAVAAELRAAFSRQLAGGVELRPGAKELVAAVARSDVPMALVTSTERSVVDAAIGGIGAGSFDVTVAGDEVEQNKPAPDPYLRAARLLGADPARCVAVEDSPVGIASAVAAGCVTVAVPSMVALEEADGLTVLDSLVGVDLRWMGALVREQRG